MRKIPCLIRDGFVQALDVLRGGTLCQVFSIGGLCNSLDDDRGNARSGTPAVLRYIGSALTFADAPAAPDPRQALYERVYGVASDGL